MKFSITGPASSRVRRGKISKLLDILIEVLSDSQSQEERNAWTEVYKAVRKVAIDFQIVRKTVVDEDNFWLILSELKGKGADYLEDYWK